MSEPARGQIPEPPLPSSRRESSSLSALVAAEGAALLDTYADALGADWLTTPGGVRERRVLIGLFLALPRSLRPSWEAVASALDVDARTIRRDASTAEAKTAARWAMTRGLGPLLLGAVRVGAAKLAARAAEGDAEALEATARLLSDLGIADEVTTPGAAGVPLLSSGDADPLASDEAAEQLAELRRRLGEHEG